MTKIVLIGAGSLQFGTGMLGDIFQSEHLIGADIVLHDINEAAAKRTLETAERYLQSNDLDFRLSANSSLDNALKNADFVVISIEVGDRFKLWDQDWNVPKQFGINQIYGENGGPGGLFHSLRIIPPILEICKSVSEICPVATVFNYSNPMSRICTTVHKAFPDLNFIGMCHEIASLERHLAPLLKMQRHEITYRAGGLNHFSVLTDVKNSKTGESLYQLAIDGAKEYFERLPGYSEILELSRSENITVETEGWMEVDSHDFERIRPWSDRLLFSKMLERFNALPITTDSHFGEYIQWAHDCSDHKGILDFYTYYRIFLGNSTPRIEDVLKERVVPIMEGLLGAGDYEEAAVNIPNAGYIKDLPSWICVEVPANISKGQISGIQIDIPVGVKGLLTNQIGVHELTSDAILKKSKDLVVQALLVDPTVNNSNAAVDLVEFMLAEQGDWLGYLT